MKMNFTNTLMYTLIYIITFKSHYYCNAYRILALQTFGGKSHYLSIQPIVEELAKRGHDVTIITTFPEKNPNYTQIVVERQVLWEKGFNLVDYVDFSVVNSLLSFWMGAQYSAENVLKSKVVQDFIKNDTSHFDLIFTEVFYQEVMYMFAHKYKAPLVGFSTSGFLQHIGNSMGNPLILSYMNHEFFRFESQKSLVQKIKNIYVTLSDLLLRHFVLLPNHQKLAEKYFSNLPQPLPQLADMEKNFSLIFLNTHFTIDVVRPLVPGIIEVGGVHIRKHKKLPDGLQAFLDEAVHGAIYFSLGSTIKSTDMTKEKLNIFMKVFGNLKQRVICKWDGDTLEGKPDNVLFGKWMPQNDILAHQNVKLFINHGGLLGTLEAIYNGVPVIGIPVYGDQYLNAKKMENRGVGLQLSYNDLTEDALQNTIQTVLNDNTYNEKSKELSRQFKDKPISPMDNTIYWIEYVIKHNGAKYMKSPILNMKFFESCMLDVWCVIFLCFILLGLAVKKFCNIVSISYTFIITKRSTQKTKSIKSHNFKSDKKNL